MTGEVAVLGSLDYLDVWNHKRFLEERIKQPFTKEDEEVLSQLGI